MASESPKPEKIDTVLVLGKLHSGSYGTESTRFLLAKRNGELVRYYGKGGNYNFSNIGDTLVIKSNDSDEIDIIKNLTMENKINAFAKQR